MATATKTRLFSTRVDIPEDKRDQVVEILNGRLAETFDLYTQVKQAHWNIKGKDFYQLHLLFDKIAADIEPFVDQIAERATALGGVALGTARSAAKNSSLPEYDFNALTGEQHLRAVAERLSLYANSCRAAIDQTDGLGDAVTADLFTEAAALADQDLYLIESHLQA
ncbi:MAG TPA: DNA starvation/stationary phase protection protein Dps [Clostridia bacterium]|nr:DNA starvation/stationary phase protection protein Dps [Clostridia bacterium]